MRDWKKRARMFGDVVFFEYVRSASAKESPLVHVWDIDKTYLDTHFESLKGLFRTALEKAFQKRNVPGTNVLVRALISSDPQGATRPFPIFFISASPPQMEKKIRQKLSFDGIKPFGSFFKDNLKNLKPSRFWRLTNHFGYKLQALLELRTYLKDDVKQILWGDDSESDAIIYSLYSDICSRRLSSAELLKILNGLRVVGEEIEAIFELREKIPVQDPVGKIYINLATDTDADYYLKFGRRMVATTNTFQSAMDLYQDRRIPEDVLLSIAQDLVINYAFTPDEIEQSLQSLMRRRIIAESTVEKIAPLLIEQGVLPKTFHPYSSRQERLVDDGYGFYRIENADGDWVPPYIDYLSEVR